MNKKLGKIVFLSLIVILLAVGIFSVFKVHTISKRESLMKEEITYKEVEEEETMKSIVIDTETKEFPLDEEIVDEETADKETVDEETADEETADEETADVTVGMDDLLGPLPPPLKSNREEEKDETQDEFSDEAFEALFLQEIEEIPVEDSTDVMSAKEAIESFNSRGFIGEDARAVCHMDGKYDSSIVITPTTEEKYPTYDLWVSVFDKEGNGYLWFVTIIDDDIMATPFIDDWVVMVSESNTMTSYDSGTNTFHKKIPAMPLIQVDYIDYDTLVELSVQHASEG